MQEGVKNICSNYCADASAAIYCVDSQNITETALRVQINFSEDLNQSAFRTETIHFIFDFKVLMNLRK